MNILGLPQKQTKENIEIAKRKLKELQVKREE